jgi:hypothetical protein
MQSLRLDPTDRFVVTTFLVLRRQWRGNLQTAGRVTQLTAPAGRITAREPRGQDQCPGLVVRLALT